MLAFGVGVAVGVGVGLRLGSTDSVESGVASKTASGVNVRLGVEVCWSSIIQPLQAAMSQAYTDFANDPHKDTESAQIALNDKLRNIGGQIDALNAWRDAQIAAINARYGR